MSLALRLELTAMVAFEVADALAVADDAATTELDDMKEKVMVRR